MPLSTLLRFPLWARSTSRSWFKVRVPSPDLMPKSDLNQQTKHRQTRLCGAILWNIYTRFEIRTALSELCKCPLPGPQPLTSGHSPPIVEHTIIAGIAQKRTTAAKTGIFLLKILSGPWRL